ncbi:MAG: Gfo/Idh/MocA family oxidoreductase, partial [Minicystis sp.]
MSAARVRVALIGCGAWGSNILRVLTESALAEVVAVADPQPLRRTSAGAVVPSAALVPSLDEALALRPHAVLLATPAHTHATLVLQALDARVDVFVEKPLALSAIDAERCAARAASAGRVTMVGHLLRYHPTVQALLAHAAGGALGELWSFEAARLSVGGDRTAPALWTLGPHDVSVLQALDPSPIRSLAAQSPPSGDEARVELELGSGLAARIELSRAHGSKERKIAVIGSAGAAVFDDVRAPDRLLLGRARRVGGELSIEIDGALPVPWEEPLAREIGHFLRCVVAREAPLTSFETGVSVVRALCRAE